MKNKIKAPSSVTIGVLTVITILFWIAFEVFRIFTTKPEPSVPREIIAPLSPTLDAEALSKLQQRVYLTDSEIGTVTFTNVNAPTPTAVPVPTPESEATVSGTPTPTPEASEEGQVTQ